MEHTSLSVSLLFQEILSDLCISGDMVSNIVYTVSCCITFVANKLWETWVEKNEQSLTS